MHYKFNRKTYIAPEDLSIAFVESVDAFEMAKLHLKEDFIELWLADIKDYDTLIFLKKQREVYKDNLEIIIFELLFYLNPKREFAFFGFDSLEIYSLKSYISEWDRERIRNPEIEHVLTNLYNGRLAYLYKLYFKHSKRKDDLTQNLFNFFPNREHFKKIQNHNVYSKSNCNAVLKIVDYLLNPYDYYVTESIPWMADSYTYNETFYIPTFSDIEIFLEYFPQELQEAFKSHKRGVTNFSNQLDSNDLRGAISYFIGNFLFKFISSKLSNFKEEIWTTQVIEYLNFNHLIVKSRFEKGYNSFFPFCINDKWGVLNGRYEAIIPDKYLNVSEFPTLFNTYSHFKVKVDADTYTVFNGYGKELFNCLPNNLGYSNANFQSFAFGYGLARKGVPLIYPFSGVLKSSEGIAIVKVYNKINYINQEGTLLLESCVDDGTNFSNGFAFIKAANEWNIINNKGEILKVKTIEQLRNKAEANTLPIASFKRLSEIKMESISTDTNSKAVVCAYSQDSTGTFKLWFNDTFVLKLLYPRVNLSVFNFTDYLYKDYQQQTLKLELGSFTLDKEGDMFYLKKEGKSYVPNLRSH
jgi:hypothetical protein